MQCLWCGKLYIDGDDKFCSSECLRDYYNDKYVYDVVDEDPRMRKRTKKGGE